MQKGVGSDFWQYLVEHLPVERSGVSQSGGSVQASYRVSAVAGGDICQAYRLTIDAASYFVKIRAAAPLDFFAAEAAGLEAIRQSRLIRVPRVVRLGHFDGLDYLLLEYVPMRAASAPAQAELGKRLARMHRLPEAAFGGGQDNWIGTTPQPNPNSDGWSAFFRQHRLLYQLELAETKGFGVDLWPLAKTVLNELEHWFVGYAVKPSLLHGDLWSGNQAMDAAGQPVLFDPASYLGDRETDLAMTELFGGFTPGFYAAYEAEWALDKGYARRRPLYQLYHVLNHLNLFGAGYLAQAQGLLQRLHRAL